ncbi:MAG: hypothetical protein JSS09_02175, partial [Verrucomicrobia bacterium]|nr:hypothetical protein [Verrucomicrobiota bacterium]
MIKSLTRGMPFIGKSFFTPPTKTQKGVTRAFNTASEGSKKSIGNKLLLGLGSFATLGTGVAIGSSDSELLSTLKKIIGLNLQKAGKSLTEENPPLNTPSSPVSAPTTQPPTTQLSQPSQPSQPSVTEKTPPPPSLATKIIHSPLTHAALYGVTGAALTASGNLPLAIMTFGIMGSTILD